MGAVLTLSILDFRQIGRLVINNLRLEADWRLSLHAGALLFALGEWRLERAGEAGVVGVGGLGIRPVEPEAA